jgi:oligopeptide/dipeptide ABC transporter ATP-binding protein
MTTPLPAGAPAGPAAPPATPRPLLELRALRVTLSLPAGAVDAVDGVDLALERGETLCLVGESGCGKSLTAAAALGLLPRRVARVTGGAVLWKGRDLLAARPEELRSVRGRGIGLVTQEPQAALDPVLRTGDQVMEAVRAHGGVSRAVARERARDLLAEVGIPDPDARLRAFPHELSGGMRQRVCVAMALAGEPELLIADEPTTALDVTVQAQVLALLAELQQRRGMALLLITHDLALVAQLGDRVAVMYAGRVVEEAPAAALFESPRHPYTQGLLASLPDRQRPSPDVDRRRVRLRAIPGTVPAPGSHGTGCRFRERCRRADAACAAAEPVLRADAGWTAGQRAACFRPLAGTEGARPSTGSAPR